MAHKHNRRRIRPRSRNYNTFVNHSLFGQPLFSKPANLSTGGIYPGTADSHFVNLDQRLKATKGSQNIHTACQTRTQRQMEETAKVELERIKLFGGVPGDDVGLCYRMLEYFGVLDFIDT
jgi:hypothetical protein